MVNIKYRMWEWRMYNVQIEGSSKARVQLLQKDIRH